jgi:parallel beta-helix repeat protein
MPSKKLRLEESLSRLRNLTLLIICLLLITSSLFQIKPVSSQPFDVPNKYETIQEAVDNATAGDTIRVASGIYPEHVVVDKSLAIEGEDPATTIVDGTANGTVFRLDGSKINITGFTIRNAGNKYEAIESVRNATTNDYQFITNNIISTSKYAVFLTFSNHNNVSGNVIEANGYGSYDGGVSVTTSTYNTIYNNLIETNQHFGIYESRSNYTTISKNVIEANPYYGVSVSASTYNTINNNVFINNSQYGLYFTGSANSNNIIGNNITGSEYSIRCEPSLNNIIEGNTISKTAYAVYIASSSSTGNTIRYNTLSGQIAGVYALSDNTIVHHNTILNCAYGIYYYSCGSGSIYYNILRGNAVGIRLYSTTSTHNVNNNKIIDNDEGIELVSANSHTFTGNWIQENAWGIYLSSGSSNNIYHNNFLNNVQQVASLTGTNNWYVSSQGNYWTDYHGKDSNGDGIGDTPYQIQGTVPLAQDNYPLMYPWNEHDIAVQSVKTSASEVDPGTIVSITAVVKNKANTTVSETFTVKAKYNTTVIGTQQVSSLGKGQNQTLVFSWNTTGVHSGTYVISAEASVVTDELNITNNSFSDGTVKIRSPLRNKGDINGDGTINKQDLTLLEQAYGSTSGSPNWYADADLNKDGLINITDLYILGKNFGTSG